AIYGTSVLSHIIFCGWLFTLDSPELSPNVRCIMRRTLREVCGQGSLFFLMFIGEAVIMQTDFLLIAHYTEPKAVPQYAVAYQIFFSAFHIIAFWVNPLWPAYTEAASRSEWEWMWSTHRRVLWQSLLMISAG